MTRSCRFLLGALESCVAIALLAIAVTVVVQVALSSLFNSSITGANEVITILFVYLTAIGAAVAIGRREHIAITLVADSMSAPMRRALERVEICLVALLNLTIVLYCVHWISVTGDYLMPTTQLPRFIAQTCRANRILARDTVLHLSFCCTG